MDGKRVIEILRAVDSASARVWIDGGWGVDALLGEKTRDHSDLDVIVDSRDTGKLEAVLRDLGFVMKPGCDEGDFVMIDAQGRQIDIHPVEFDANGYACFQLPDGCVWPFPEAAFRGKGQIEGQDVKCLSVDAQVQCHAQGYVPKESDLDDMARLQERFGVVLPPVLCRRGKLNDRPFVAA